MIKKIIFLEEYRYSEVLPRNYVNSENEFDDKIKTWLLTFFKLEWNNIEQTSFVPKFPAK
jgi:hypothetical protein